MTETNPTTGTRSDSTPREASGSAPSPLPWLLNRLVKKQIESAENESTPTAAPPPPAEGDSSAN